MPGTAKIVERFFWKCIFYPNSYCDFYRIHIILDKNNQVKGKEFQFDTFGTFSVREQKRSIYD